MAFIIPFSYHLADTIAFLILCSVGLAIVFGMMGVINIAHGEFIMLGAYVTTIASRWGVPLPVAMLLAILVTGLAGVLLERLVIRHLYGRLFDSIVATWAISLIAMQGMLILAGPSMTSVGTPLGDFSAAGYTFSTYRLVLISTAVALLGLVYLVFMHTRFGVYARATIQRPDIARALGLNVNAIYAVTFGLGAALAGLAGALYAPTMSIVPTMGSAFIVQAFVTVVVGGGEALVGTAPAAVALGLIQTALTAQYGTLAGQIGLLLTVIVVIRVLPSGISGWLKRQ